MRSPTSSKSRLRATTLVGVLALGCVQTEEPESSTPDAASTTTVETTASESAKDAGSDATVSASSGPELDAASQPTDEDASLDVWLVDAGPDGGDAATSPEAGGLALDAGDTGALDASRPDGGTRSSADAGSCADLPSESLLVNGDFELPVVAAGSYQLFAPGASFEGWSAVGSAGEVAPLSGSYQGSNTVFTAYEGAQTMDLTGTSAANSGISQTVATEDGVRYCVSFWSGNAVNWGAQSVVNVLINGQEVLVAINADAIANELAWKNYSFSFVAVGDQTELTFMNGDAGVDNSNIIDAVVLKRDE